MAIYAKFVNGEIIPINRQNQDALYEWIEWFEASVDRVVTQTEIGKGVRVSTVFLGINYAFSEDQSPLWFETMVFGGEHDQFYERYSTLEEAMLGHERAVAMVTED